MADDEDHHCKHIVANDQTAARYCRNIATIGNYCGKHSVHPQRRVEQATVSLYDYVEDAMRALGDIVRDEHGTVKEADRIRAANSILDRTGHVPAHAITLQGANAQLDERLSALLADRAPDDDSD